MICQSFFFGVSSLALCHAQCIALISFLLHNCTWKNNKNFGKQKQQVCLLHQGCASRSSSGPPWRVAPMACQAPIKFVWSLEVWLSNSLHASTYIRPHILSSGSSMVTSHGCHVELVPICLSHLLQGIFFQENGKRLAKYRTRSCHLSANLAQLPGWPHVLNSRRWKQTTNAKNTSRVFVPIGVFAELAGAISKRTWASHSNHFSNQRLSLQTSKCHGWFLEMFATFRSDPSTVSKGNVGAC